MIEDLFREEEKERVELPRYETLNRRPFRILVGSLVGVFLASLACMLVYFLVVVPGNRDREEAQARLVETQNASIASTLLAESATGTPAPSASPTPLPSPSPTQPPPTSSPSPTETQEPTPSPTPEPTVTPSPLPQVLLTDAFGGGSAWVVQTEENFELNYSGGGYRMFVNIFFAEIWSVRGQTYGDVRLEVDTARQAGPEDGFYGVVCRFQNDANYYSLVIDGQAGYRIFKKVGGQVEDLAGPSPAAVVQTQGTNRLRADCIGDTLRLFVNGELLAEVRDAEFSEGSVGMLAGTRAVPGTEVIFDNLLLAVP